MIEIKGLTKIYGKKSVFKDLSVTFEKGLVHGILGPNGCGKTTLIKCILGLAHSKEGQFLLNGESLASHRDQVSWLPQHPQAPLTTTPAQLFKFIEGLRGQKAVFKDHLIKEFDFTAEMNKPLSALSGGNYQKCFLIATLMFQSPLIILDEPTVGLDPIAGAVFKKVLKERSADSTVLLISHISSEIYHLSDKVHFLLDGRWVFQGLVREINSSSNFRGFEEFIIDTLSPKRGLSCVNF